LQAVVMLSIFLFFINYICNANAVMRFQEKFMVSLKKYME